IYALSAYTSSLIACTATLLFSLQGSAAHRALHSFPTRRSSDLAAASTRSGPTSPASTSSAATSSAATSSGRCTAAAGNGAAPALDRKSTRLNSSHVKISYAVFCLKKKKKKKAQKRKLKRQRMLA